MIQVDCNFFKNLRTELVLDGAPSSSTISINSWGCYPWFDFDMASGYKPSDMSFNMKFLNDINSILVFPIVDGDCLLLNIKATQCKLYQQYINDHNLPFETR